jgi:FkbM family methyltransferase
MKIIRTKDEHIFVCYNKKIFVIDLGYNDGSFERDISKLYEVYEYIGIEANPSFKTSIKAKLFNFAVSNESQKKIEFGVDCNNSGSSSAVFLKNKKKIYINSITLKDLYKLSSFNRIDILKIDIEGSEYNILTEENISFLSENTEQILIEFHNTSIKEYSEKIDLILEYFKKNNFYAKKFSFFNKEMNCDVYTFINEKLISINFFFKIQLNIFKYSKGISRLLKRILKKINLL